MISSLFKSKSLDKKEDNQKSKYPISKKGSDLLQSQSRVSMIRKIKRLFSVTENVWLNHYLFAIEQFAELVQEVPASEIHHHSNEGGLIDHTLEALVAGIKISQGYILPPNSDPEEITAASDRWRFGAFIAILSHDIGKIVTDIEIVYRVNNQDFQYWHPWYENIPVSAEYSYRYKDRINNSKLAKSLHEKASMSLLPRLLTKKAAQWIFEDTELLSQLFSTVTHSTFGGQAIAEIVRTADRSSVSNNLGAETGKNSTYSANIPLHEKLIVSLRKLIIDGELKRNKPGAAIWVTDTETWVVSKATMEAVRLQLLSEGHKGIPKNVVRLFEVLREHELLIANPEGESIWSAKVNDFQKNWQQVLTFLRFKNEIIWPTNNPDKFDGEIIPVDRSGNPLSTNTITENKVEKPQSADKSNTKKLSQPRSRDNALPTDTKQPTLHNEIVEDLVLTDNSLDERAQPKKPFNKQSYKDPEKSKVGVSSIEAKNMWKHSRKVQEELLSKNDFISWLLKNIARRRIRVNEPKAPVHVLEKHIALVTPIIFNLYLDKNSLKKHLYEKRAEGKKVYTLLQRELEGLDIHQKGTNGQNIVKMSVEGQRSQSELRVYLLNRECFPSLSNFSPNSVMSIHL